MTQKEQILKLLTDAGKDGINSFGIARELSLQLPARIWELRQLGHEIISKDEPDSSVTYILYGNTEIHQPTETKFFVKNGKYYARLWGDING